MFSEVADFYIETRPPGPVLVICGEKWIGVISSRFALALWYLKACRFYQSIFSVESLQWCGTCI
jgi:hypothetical protein